MESNFNDKAGAKKPGQPSKEGLTPEQAKEKLNLYQSIGHDADHALEYERIKHKYGKDLNQLDDKKIERDINYASGIRHGLPHAPHHILKAMDDYQKQKITDKAMDKAKDYYDKNNSLSKDFNKERDDPEMEKE